MSKVRKPVQLKELNRSSFAFRREDFQIFTVNLGGVVGRFIMLRPKLFQIASQRSLTVAVECRERSLRGSVIGAEMFDDFRGRKGKVEAARPARQFQF